MGWLGAEKEERIKKVTPPLKTKKNNEKKKKVHYRYEFKREREREGGGTRDGELLQSQQ